MTHAFWRALGAEFAKLLRQPAARVLGIILVGYLGVIVLAFYSILRAPAVEGFDKEAFLAPLRADALGFTLALFSGTAIIALVVWAALLIGHELSRATLRTVLLAGIPRGTFVASKLAVIGVLSVPLAALGLLFAAGATLVFGAATGEGLLRADAADLGWRFVGLVAVLAGWGLLAFALTLWTASLGAGIGSTMGLLIVGDLMSDLLGAAGSIGLYASRVLPTAAFNALLGSDVPTMDTWVWALPNLLAWLGLLPWLAARRFKRADALALTR